MKAKEYVADDHPQPWDWNRIENETASMGTVWRYTPAGCQHRNGLSESRVKILKATLNQLLPINGPRLNYEEFRVLLVCCADRINDRPLGVRANNGVEEEVQPVTANMLLLGRSSPWVSSADNFQEEDSTSRFTKRARFLRNLEDA